MMPSSVQYSHLTMVIQDCSSNETIFSAIHFHHKFYTFYSKQLSETLMYIHQSRYYLSYDSKNPCHQPTSILFCYLQNKMDVKSLIFARYARSPKQKDMCFFKTRSRSQSQGREGSLQRAVTLHKQELRNICNDGQSSLLTQNEQKA